MQCCDILQTLKESEIKKGVVGRVVHKAVGEFPLESRVWTCNKMCITTTIIVTLCVLYAGFRTKIKSACTTLRFRSSDKTEEIAGVLLIFPLTFQPKWSWKELSTFCVNTQWFACLNFSCFITSRVIAWFVFQHADSWPYYYNINVRVVCNSY